METVTQLRDPEQLLAVARPRAVQLSVLTSGKWQDTNQVNPRRGHWRRQTGTNYQHY